MRTRLFLVFASALMLIAFLTLGNATIAFSQTDETGKSDTLECKVLAITLCKQVENREPVNVGEEFSVADGQIYCFTPVFNRKGDAIIKHLWYREGVLMFSIDLKIGSSDRWRTWSSKSLYPGFEGNWEVVVKTADDMELGRKKFVVK